MHKPLIATCVFLSLVLPCRAENWVKVKSPHFTVISNGSEKQARQVALGFEEIQAVFTSVIPGLRTEASAETIVFAAKDVNTFAELLPFEKSRLATWADSSWKGGRRITWLSGWIFRMKSETLSTTNIYTSFCI